MKRTLLFAFVFISINTHTQTLTVIDATTRQTIAGVVLYAKNPVASAITNAKGQVKLNVFTGADSIYFQHVSYSPVIFSYSNLQSKFFIVELTALSISLDEVVVSANRWEQEKIEIPYRIAKISMRDASFENSQTSADLLGSGGYVYVQKSQLAGGSPMLRGFATNRVLLVVDGVRMNNAIFRLGNLQNVISLDAGSFEDVEVLFGPGAVIYGSDAIGGVMDFHTLRPVLSTEKQMVITGNALARYSSASNEKTGHLDFNIGLKKWAFTTSLTYADYDDLRAGSHGNSYFLRRTYQDHIHDRDTMLINDDPEVQVESGFSQLYLMQKILYKPVKDLRIDYSIHYSFTSDAPRYDRLCLDENGDGTLDNAEWYYGPQKWLMNRLGISYTRTTGLFDQMRLIAAFQNYEESRHDRKFNNNRLRNQTEKVNAGSLNIDLDKKISDKITLYYGTEAILNQVGSTANRINIMTKESLAINTRYPDGSTWQAYGFYVSAKYKIIEYLILNGGLRYSYYKVKADFDTAMFPFPVVHTENNNGALNGSIGMVFMPTDSWQIYVNGGTGFHAPNIDDMAKVFDSEPGSVVVPNPGLKPEYAWNVEVGTSKIFGRFMKADITAYFTYLDNALSRRNFQFNGMDSILYDGEMSRVQAIQNITRAYVWGIQAGVKILIGKGLELNSVLSYQKGMEQDEVSLVDYPLRHAAPLFGSTHLTYERKNLKFDFYSVYNSKMDFEDLALSERQDDAPYAKDDQGNPFVPGWYTLNFKGAWYINRTLALNAGIENITDRLYRPYASGLSAPGRNFMVALRARF
ncbi:MAG: TonB-dependent receptor [Bacteroidales bacterium]|nr:TonB-dependent receptor [Bacteroidales bacterium]